jgi:hypothetical protein
VPSHTTSSPSGEKKIKMKQREKRRGGVKKNEGKCGREEERRKEKKKEWKKGNEGSGQMVNRSK